MVETEEKLETIEVVKNKNIFYEKFIKLQNN